MGCKSDLRRDPKTIEELRRTSQKPVTRAEVRFNFFFLLVELGGRRRGKERKERKREKGV